MYNCLKLHGIEHAKCVCYTNEPKAHVMLYKNPNFAQHGLCVAHVFYCFSLVPTLDLYLEQNWPVSLTPMCSFSAPFSGQ